ncbi:MAG: sugar phosphate nucleotidyltransferase [bacterium]
MKIAVILCGGFGKRLFPLSRTNYPKQFVKIFDGKSLLELTYQRIKTLGIFDKILVVANKRHLYLVLRDIPDIGQDIILEEEPKNTAYAILLGIYQSFEKFGVKESSFVFFPSDHYILNHQEFDNSIAKLVSFMQKFDKTFIIGVKPSFPSTEYGYIKKGEMVDEDLFQVHKFVEKPNKSKARYYLKTGSYLWNSGIYAFKSSFFLEDFFLVNSHLKEFNNLKSLIDKSNYFPSISIDYLYSQKTKNLYVLKSTFGWSDLGSFEEITKISNHDIEKLIAVNSKANIILDEFEVKSPKKYCLINVKDVVIVDTKDFQLISKKGKSKNISYLLDQISQEQKDFNTFDFRPWGFYREIENNEQNYRIKNITIYPHQEISLQYHQHRDEYWVVIKGYGRIIINNQQRTIKRGDFIYIPKGTIHKAINDSDESMEILEIQLGEILSEKDIVRISDKYNREG